MLKWYYGGCQCTDMSNKDLANIEDLLQLLETKISQLESSITTQSPNVSTSATALIWDEYIKYIELYGMPVNGVWDQTLLQQIIDQSNT